MSCELIGTNYGGFYYPKDLPYLNEKSIVYSFGAGEDISHDVILGFRLKCPIFVFDPTPRGIEHVQYVKDVLDNKKKPQKNTRFGGGNHQYWDIILSNRIEGSKIILEEYGLYTEDGYFPFYFPKNEEYVSCSLSKLGRSDKYINVPVKTLNTIMKDLNHQHIDLLKMDIENIECDVLEKMLNDKIYPTYISVDFDLMHHNKQRCNEVIKRLTDNGYSIIMQSGQDFSFMRRNII